MAVDDVAALAGEWSFPTTIWFGAGSIARLAEACDAVGVARPLVVTDKALAASDMVGAAVADLRAAGRAVAVYDGATGNPVRDDVDRGCAACRDHGADGVVAFGGGSALDVGKMVATLAGRPDFDMWTLEDGGDGWRDLPAAALLPVVAVATTAGTGSETGRAGVITDPATGTKRILFHPAMMPKRVIADPALTASLPVHLTAATGMDALAHNLEALCAVGHQPFCDGVALNGLKLIHDHLARAVADGGDLIARAAMMAAAMMGSTAFQKGLGAVHALSHPVGAAYGSHHGLTNGVLLPPVVAYNRPAIEARMIGLAALLGLPGQGTTAVVDWLLALRAEIGIPNGLDALGVTAADIPRLAAQAAVDPTAASNPRPLDAGVCASLYEHGLAGTLP